MHISGTEPSLVILSKTKLFKNLKTDPQKCRKKDKARRDGVINQQSSNFNPIFTQNILILSKCYESTVVDGRTWLHMSSGTLLSERQADKKIGQN